MLVRQDGSKVCQCKARHQDLDDFSNELAGVIASAKEAADEDSWEGLTAVCLGMEKSHRSHFNYDQAAQTMPRGIPLLVLPAASATLLGAIPSGPGLLVSMSANLRLAVIDSTQTYREFRLSEGGAGWWLLELQRLSEHSAGLAREMAKLGPGELKSKIRYLPRLLELGDFPAPDPVLKPRLDKISTTIADSCMGICTRLPGVKRISFAGFLHPGSMSERIEKRVMEEEPKIRFNQPQFPPEVGAALMGLAYLKENQERAHLEKPLFEGHAATGKEWTPSPVLLRRLYRLRKPFEHFPN